MELNKKILCLPSYVKKGGGGAPPPKTNRGKEKIPGIACLSTQSSKLLDFKY